MKIEEVVFEFINLMKNVVKTPPFDDGWISVDVRKKGSNEKITLLLQEFDSKMIIETFPKRMSIEIKTLIYLPVKYPHNDRIRLISEVIPLLHNRGIYLSRKCRVETKECISFEIMLTPIGIQNFFKTELNCVNDISKMKEDNTEYLLCYSDQTEPTEIIDSIGHSIRIIGTKDHRWYNRGRK